MRWTKGLAALLVIVLAMPAVASAERVQIWGSTTLQKQLLEPSSDALKAATGVTVNVVGVGTGRGLLALFENKIPVAASSSSLEEAIQAALKVASITFKPVKVPDNLQYYQLAQDVIVPIVHRSNPVQSLSAGQLRAIFTGQIDNWKQLGGEDLPIQVVMSSVGSATRSVFREKVLRGDSYTDGLTEVETTRSQIEVVSNNPAAIGALSEAFVEQHPGQVKIVVSAPIIRPLALITLGPPTEAVQKVIDFYRSGERSLAAQ